MRVLSLLLVALAAFFVAGESCSQCPRLGPPTYLIQELTSSDRAYPIGAPIKFTYSIKNTEFNPRTYSFTQGKMFDFWITWNGCVVYRLPVDEASLPEAKEFTLEPYIEKTFAVSWDQKDSLGNQVPPGAYTAVILFEPEGETLSPTNYRFEIGTPASVVTKVSVKEGIGRIQELEGRRVQIAGVYEGLEPPRDDANLKGGPPVTRHDWILCDTTGCLYVHGRTDLNPKTDVGKKTTVTGKLEQLPDGQVYLDMKRPRIADPARAGNRGPL